jgi:hypothetical protein
MKDGMFDPSDILIDGKPSVYEFRIEGAVAGTRGYIP